MKEVKSGTCVYRIIKASSLEQLEEHVADIIAQGWNADSVVGGVGNDGKTYYQVLVLCPSPAAVQE